MPAINILLKNIYIRPLRILLMFCAVCLSFLSLDGQPQFVSMASHYGINHIYGEGTAGGGVSFADFNGDKRDDLTLAVSGGEKIHFYLNQATHFIKLDLLPQTFNEVKHILWVDYDNDGDRDLYLTLADDYNRLFRNNGNLQLVDVTDQVGLNTDVLTSFGACWGDYNRDGFLDLYYGLRRIEKTGEPNISKLWMNRKNHFTDKTIESDTEDGGKTPFCSSFLDYNNDRWPDIYTAHDRKRGNTLLKNNADGTFSDVSAVTGTDLKMDGMSVSVGDFNKDNLDDMYVSNSEAGNALFVNKGNNFFSNDADTCGVAFHSIAWGTNFLDGDLDGDLDLYVSGMLPGTVAVNSQYYINNYPEYTFTKGAKITGDTASSFNNAVGDFNSDGSPDIAVINVGPYPTLLFENTGAPNNHIKVNLQGVKSNRDGIGSVITLYAGGKPQRVYTQCGTGFMGQNSYNYLFGLGQSSTADSITVLWPTGHKDVITDITANRSLVITEGMSTGGVINIDPDVNLLDPSQTHEYGISSTGRLEIFPNPSLSDSEVKVVSGNLCIAEICIFNTTGQKTKTMAAPGSSGVFNIYAPEQAGIYYVLARRCDGTAVSGILLVK